MTFERNQVREQLEEELSGLKFRGHEEVMKRLQPVTWRERLQELWNREIEVPLVPVGLMVALIAGASFWLRQPTDVQDPRADHPKKLELIEVAGNVYWKEDYERMIAHAENSD